MCVPGADAEEVSPRCETVPIGPAPPPCAQYTSDDLHDIGISCIKVLKCDRWSGRNAWGSFLQPHAASKVASADRRAGSGISESVELRSVPVFLPRPRFSPPDDPAVTDAPRWL